MRRVRSQFLQLGLAVPFGRFEVALVVAAAVALLALAIPSAALAQTTSSRAFLGTLGSSSGTLGGDVPSPSAVAVNRTGNGGVPAGTVYVTSNQRISQFDPDGSFVRAWGVDVIQSGAPGDLGSGVFEICASAADCQAGTVSGAAGSISSLAAQGLAVDQATGTVYINNPTSRRVEVFSADGDFEGAFGWGVISNSTAALQFCTTATGCVTGLTGAGAGQFAAQQVSVAVDPVTGHVFVGSMTNARVDEFAPVRTGGAVTGVSFVKAFGWNVAPGAVDEEQAVTVRATAGSFTLTYAGDTTADIPAGAAAAVVESALNALGSISSGGGAVTVTGGPGDASGASPYVVRFAAGPLAAIDVAPLTATGGSVALSGGSPASGVSVATRANGSAAAATGLKACTTASGCKAGTSGGGAGQFAGPSLSIGVDSTGSIYVLTGATLNCAATQPCRVQTFASDGSSPTLFAASELSFVSGGIKGHRLAVDPVTDHVFVAQTVSAGVQALKEFDSAGTLLDVSPNGGLAGGNPLGIATDGGDRSYFITAGAAGAVNILGPVPAPSTVIAPVTDVTRTTATFHGTVTIPEPGFATTYRFEHSSDGVHWTESDFEESVGGGVAGDYPVSLDVKGLSPNTAYSVRLVATTGPSATSTTATFVTDAAPPAITQVVAAPTADSAELSAWVNPQHQSTSYHFEWGTTSAYGNRAPAFDRSIGSGSEPIAAQETLTGLSPNTTYHYRIVADHPTDATTSDDQTFTTDKVPGQYGNRVPELVSPPDKGGPGAVSSFIATEAWFVAAPDGNSVFYPIEYGLPGAPAGGATRYIATRGTAGWDSVQVTPRPMVPTNPLADTEWLGRHGFLAPDNSCAVLASGQPLTADAPMALNDNGGANLFRRTGSDSYQLLTPLTPTNVDDPTIQDAVKYSQFGGYRIVGASPDCRRVVFATPYRYAGLNSSGLYESDGGTLRDVGVLPDGSAPSGQAEPGVGNQSLFQWWRAVSRDASRVYFTAMSNSGNDNGKRALYRREDEQTTKVSGSQTPVVNQGAYYQIASGNGARVAFLANYGLTADSNTEGPANGSCEADPPRPCALYVHDAETGELTDISSIEDPGLRAANTNGATVGGVLAASDDLERIYFVARGQLVAGEGRTYRQNELEQTYNIYLWDEGELSFVAAPVTIGSGDQSLVLSLRSFSNSQWTSRATPDGRHLLFSTAQDVKGYDSGVRQAYLYSADSGELACLSCRRDRRPSMGGSDQNPLLSLGSTVFTALDQPPVNLTADGSRAFFTSRDALAPGAVEGQTNVYEWNRGVTRLVYSGRSDFDASSGPATELFGVSASGDDVFIRTTASLDPRDDDGAYDLYDFRVDGGLPRPAEPPESCAPLAGACQGAGETASPQRLDTTQPGAGNGPLSERASLRLARLTKAQRTALAAGRKAGIVVAVNRSGTITIRGIASVNGIRGTVISASRRTAGAARVAVPVSLSKPARQRLARTGRMKVRLTVRFSGAPRTVTQTIAFTKSTRSNPVRRATVPAPVARKAR